jgi:hypothetical protein
MAASQTGNSYNLFSISYGNVVSKAKYMLFGSLNSTEASSAISDIGQYRKQNGGQPNRM